MRKIFSLVALLFLFGCQSTSLDTLVDEGGFKKFPKTVEISGVKFDGVQVENGVISKVKFKSYQDLTNEIRVQSQNEMWSEEKTNQRLSMVNSHSKNGYFYIVGYAYTIGAASGGYLKAIFIQNGEALQKKPMKGTANVPSHHGGYGSEMWWNSTILSPRELIIDQPFEIRVVSTIGKTVSRYVYTPIIEQP